MNRNLENIVVLGIYRSPRGNINAFKDHFRATMSKNTLSKGEFNINSLDYLLNEYVKFF